MLKENFQEKIILQKCHNLASEIADYVNLTPAIFDAFAKTQRELFVPSGFKHHAYKLDALPMASSQWISSPLTVAKMTEALEVKDCDSVLEIGCGSGYQAAILSRLFRRVFTIERVEHLLQEAKERFKMLNLVNIHARFDDGQRGWRDFAPYDRILFSASTPKVPENLFDQLKLGGVLVAPIEVGEKQIITKFYKNEDGITSKSLDSCYFVPVKDGVKR